AATPLQSATAHTRPQRVELFQHVGHQRSQLGYGIEIALQGANSTRASDIPAAESPLRAGGTELAERAFADVPNHPFGRDGAGTGELVDTQCSIVHYRPLQRLVVVHLSSPFPRADRTRAPAPSLRTVPSRAAYRPA